MAAHPIINGMDFARKAQEVHGTIAVSQFSRLQDALASNGDALSWRLLGDVEEGKPRLHLWVRGLLHLTCQRCLEPLEYELDISALYYLVANESAIPSDDDESDDRDFLVAETQMQVAELIEEEVLLALPYAAKHASCDAEVAVKDAGKPNPFAVLQGLKTSRNRTN